jgi:L-malate glycosyltransferase
MKILQLVTRRQYRGAEVFAATLSDELIQKGLSIVFVGLYPPPNDPLAVKGAVNIDLNGSKAFVSIALLKKVITCIHEHQPDVIQANGSDTLKYAVLGRMFSRKKPPVIYRNISVVSTWVGKSFFKKTFYQQLFARVDFVTSVGHESIKDLQNFFGYPEKRTRVIRRGIPMHKMDRSEARENLLRKLKLPSSVSIIMHAGNYSKEKNHEFLLSIFSILKQRDTDIKLVLLGDGNLYQHITRKIREKDLADTVIQVGLQPDIASYLAAADLFVLCSKVEGVPGVILEAGVQGVPSISSDVGGVREVIRDDETGVVMNDFNAMQYANTITGLLSDRQKLIAMGKLAREFVVENFNSEKNATLFIQLYSDLIKERVQ